MANPMFGMKMMPQPGAPTAPGLNPMMNPAMGGMLAPPIPGAVPSGPMNPMMMMQNNMMGMPNNNMNPMMMNMYM